MKRKITRRDAIAMCDHVIFAGYCELQHCMPDDSREVAYNSGIYGWNWDLIRVGNGVYVCTGYRGMVGNPLPEDLRSNMADLQIKCNGFANNSMTWEKSKEAKEKSKKLFYDYVRKLEGGAE